MGAQRQRGQSSPCLPASCLPQSRLHVQKAHDLTYIPPVHSLPEFLSSLVLQNLPLIAQHPARVLTATQVKPHALRGTGMVVTPKDQQGNQDRGGRVWFRLLRGRPLRAQSL